LTAGSDVSATALILNEMNRQTLSKVLDLYGIVFKDISNEEIYGAPSRAADRTVVTDVHGKRFLVEKHHFWNMQRKEKLADNINLLHKNGFLSCTPYVENPFCRSVTEFDNRCWMVAPFVEHETLDRPGYLDSHEAGLAAAETLIKIYEVSSKTEMNDVPGGFSLLVHTNNLMSKIRSCHKEIYLRIKEPADVIEKHFSSVIISSRTLFCHGDYHPLNILWKNNVPVSVIDWEFSGYRPALTDIANMIGCAGFEDFTAFDRSFVKEFLKTIKTSGFFSDRELEDLSMFILGFRFSGWLNEWINDSDNEMIEREINYLNFLKERL